MTKLHFFIRLLVILLMINGQKNVEIMKGKKMKKNFLLILLLVLAVFFASCTIETEENSTPEADETTATDMQNESEDETETEVTQGEANVIHLTDDNFHETISNSEGVVIIDFWAEWCAPCVKLGPILEEISKEEGIVLYKVNVDDCAETATEFKITGIPMVYIYKDGEMVDSQVGLGDKDFYLEMIDEYRE